MTDHQATLGVIVLLVMAVLAFAGFRSARKGRVDDSLFVNYDKRLGDQQTELKAIRVQMERDRRERIASEDALRQRVAELEVKLAQTEWVADRRRQQIESAGMVPVV